jgi:NitT/TauT family transport system permease protein
MAASLLHTPRVFSLIIYLSLLGLTTFGIVVWLQHKLIFWHKETVAEEMFEQ